MPTLSFNGDGIDPVTGLTTKDQKPQEVKVSKTTLDDSFMDSGFLPERTQQGIDVSKYEKYVPGGNVFINEGLDNARAYGQSSAEKWGHGSIKFLGKTLTAGLGGTVGAVIGLPNAMTENRSVYDNDFQRMLDRWNEGMDERLPNYYTKQEQEAGFLKSLGSANFWANDVLGAMSFTAGAVLTELVWSAATAGLSNVGLVGRAGRYLKNFSRADDVGAGMTKLMKQQRMGDYGRTARQIYTGAGYEAGVEARQHKHELRNALVAEWEQANPDKEMPPEVVLDIENTVTTSANGVFAANVGIVGLSNMVALSRIYGPGIKRQVGAFAPIKQQLDEVGEGVKKLVYAPAYKSAGRLKTGLEGAYLVGKNPIVEGVWEEGMQGVANNTGLDYSTKKYSPSGTIEGVSLMESIGEGFAETYGGKQGWKEIGIGMLIGGVGMPNFRAYKRTEKGKLQRVPTQPIVAGGIAGEFQERNARRERTDEIVGRLNEFDQEKLVDWFKSRPEHLKSTVSLIEHMSRMGYLNSEMDAAIAAGSVFDSKNIEHDMLHSFIMSRIDGGYGADLTEELESIIDGMSEEDFATAFGYPEMTTEKVAERKNEAMRMFQRRVQETEDIVRQVDQLFRVDLRDQDNRDKRESLIYSASVIKDTEAREKNMAEEISKITKVPYDPAKRGENYKEEYKKEVAEAMKGLDEDVIRDKEVDNMLNDLEKLQRRRELYVKQYNYLFTKAGQREWSRYKAVVDQIQKMEQEKEEEKDYEGPQILVDKNTKKRYRKRKKRDGKEFLVEVNENNEIIEGGEEFEWVNDPEIRALYDVEEDIIESQPFSPEEQDSRVKWLKENKNLDNLIGFVEQQVRHRNLPTNDPVITAVNEAFKRLMGKTVPHDLLTNVRYKDSMFKDKESGLMVLVRKDSLYPDKFYVKEPKERYTAKNIEVIERDQLYNKYEFVNHWDAFEERRLRIENIDDMIETKMVLLDQTEADEKSLRQQYAETVEQLTQLREKLLKQQKDGRSLRSPEAIKRTKEAITTAQEAIESTQRKINEAIVQQAKLERNIQYLYQRMNEEENTDGAKKFDLEEKAFNLLEEIDKTKNTITRYQNIREKLKDLINDLLESIGIGRAFKSVGTKALLDEYEAQVRNEMLDQMTEGTPTMLVKLMDKNGNVETVRITDPAWKEKQAKIEENIREKLAKKKEQVERVIKRSDKADEAIVDKTHLLNKLAEDITDLQDQIVQMEEEYTFIEEEHKALQSFKRADQRKATGFRTTQEVQRGKSKRSVSEGNRRYYNSDEESPNPTGKSSHNKFWTGLKRSLFKVFDGLAGRHVMNDGMGYDVVLNPDENQRRYYRWVESTNVTADKKYYVEVTKPPEEHRSQIEDEGYNFEETLYARVIDRDGNYLKEDGTTTKNFRHDRNIYTSIPLDLETFGFGERFYRPQTDWEWDRMFPGDSRKVQEDKFEKVKEDMGAGHIRWREKIFSQLEDKKNPRKVYLRVTGKSLGIPNDPYLNEPPMSRTNHSVEEVLGHSDVEIAVNTLGSFPIGEAQVKNKRKGVTFIYDNEEGNVYEARPRGLTNHEIDMVINLFRSIVNNSKYTYNEDGSVFVGTKNSSKLKYKDGSESPKSAYQYLYELAFWTGDNEIEDENGKVRPFNKNPNTTFHFSQKELDKALGGTIIVADKPYPLLVMVEGKAVLNEALIAPDGSGAMREFLEGKLMNVSSKALRSQENFLELTSVDENGIITDKVHRKQKKTGGYKTYLLEDGDSPRVLGLSIAPEDAPPLKVVNTDGSVVDEPLPKLLSQYLMIDHAIDHIYNDIASIPEVDPPQKEADETGEEEEAGPATKEPSENYVGLNDLAEGDRLKVQIRDGANDKITHTGIIRLEDDKFEVIGGNVHATALQYLNESIISSNPDELFEAFRGNLRLMEDLRIEVAELAPAKPTTKTPTKTKVADNAEKREEEKPKTNTEEDKPEDIKRKFTRNKREDDLDDPAPFRDPTGDSRGLEDLDKAEAWFKERFPQIDFKRVQHLIDGHAHGQLSEAIVYIYENAEVGTTYHEAFHVVTHVFLTRREREALYDEYRKRNPKFADKKNRWVEEQLAEHFREYILYREEINDAKTRQLSNDEFKKLLKEFNDPNTSEERVLELDKILAEAYYAPGEMISPEAKKFQKTLKGYQIPVQKNLFEKIYDWIMKVFNRQTRSIIQVFEDIESNQFRNETPNIAFARDFTFDRSLKGKSEHYTKMVMDGVNFYFFRGLKDNVEILYSKGDNTEFLKNLYNKIYNVFQDKGADLMELWEAEPEGSYKEHLWKLVKEYEFILDNWDSAQGYPKGSIEAKERSVRGLHINFLSKYNIEPVINDENLPESQKGIDPDNQWANESIKISSRMTTSRNVKLLLGSIVDVVQRDDGTFDHNYNELRLPSLIDFGTAFNLLANQLAGVTSPAKMNNILKQLVKDHPYIEGIIKRFKLDEVDSRGFTRQQALRQVQFVQAFAKNNNQYLMDISGQNGKFNTVDQNRNSVRETTMLRWENNTSGAKKPGLYKTDPETGIKTYNADHFKRQKDIGDHTDAFNFLKKLGIEYSNPEDIIADRDMRNDLKIKAQAVLNMIKKGQQISIFDIDYNTNVGEDFEVLIALEVDTTIDFIENSFVNSRGSSIFAVVLNNLFSLTLNDIINSENDTEFYEENPHLRANRDYYNQNSILLRRRGTIDENGREMKGGFIFDENGNRIEDSIAHHIHHESKTERLNAKSFDSLNEPDQIRIHLAYGMENTYPLIRPADNSIERYISFDQPFFESTEIADKAHIEQMVLYLKDELNRAASLKDRDGDLWYNSSANMDGIVISIMSDNKYVKDQIDSFINTPEYTIESFMQNNKLQKEIRQELTDYFSDRLDSMRELIIENGIVQEDGQGGYVNNGLNLKASDGTTQLSVLDRNKLDTELRKYIVNDTVSNIEQTKLIFSSPTNYSSIKDMFKRNAGIVGTKKISAVYESINQWIEKNLLRTDAERRTSRDTLGDEKPIVRTVVFADVLATSNLVEHYRKFIGNKADAYAGMEEGDGQGYITIDEYREMLFRAGEWGFGVGEMEDWYQWEIQKEANPNATPTDPITKREIDPKTLPVAKPLKPQYMGPLAEEGNHMGMYKLSLLPLAPSMTKQFPQMEALRQRLKHDGIGVAVFHSASKGDVKINGGSVQALYNDKGEFAFEDAKTPLVYQDTYYKFWGIQQDMGTEPKRRVVTGTQMMKQIINGIFQNGKAVKGKEHLAEHAREYEALNERRIKLGIEQLTEEIGIEFAGADTYRVRDMEKMIRRFKREANRRQVADNVLDGIDSLIKNPSIDGLVNRETLENIIMGIASSATTSQKRLGSGLIQVTNAIGKHTRNLHDKTTKGNVFGSSELEFYTNEKGEVTQMEIYVSQFIPGVDENTDLTKLDPKLLEIIGFRIPTQALSSIESIKIKGFLPASMGDTVIVPTEIIAKTGSDFDIDKLSAYFPNFYLNPKGKPIYIEYSDNTDTIEQGYLNYKKAQRERILRLFSRRTMLTKEVNRMIDSLSLQGNLTPEMLHKELSAAQARAEGVASEELQLEYRLGLGILANMIRRGETEPLLIESTEYEKRAVENRITELQKLILLDPSNFANLINPITEYSKELEAEAEDIRELTGEERVETVPMYSLVEREYLAKLALQFIGANTNIGVTAIHSTFDIHAKENDFSIVSEIITEEGEEGTPTFIRLPHNMGPEGTIDLAKINAKDTKENIPERLGQWINAAVDAIKNPFMYDLNTTPDTINVVLYLTMSGVPLRTLSRYMNQPIIHEYLKNKGVFQSQMMRGNTYEVGGKERKRSKTKEQVQEYTEAKYISYLGGEGNIPDEYGEFTNDDLSRNIKRGDDLRNKRISELGQKYSIQQVLALRDFLRYEESAEQLRKATTAINYDTAEAGSNVSEMLFRLRRTKEVIKDGFINNYERLFEEGFIKPYYEAVEKLEQMLNPFFMVLNDVHAKSQLEKVFNVINDKDVNLTDDKKIKVLDRFKQDFVSYILTTMPYSFMGQPRMLNDTRQTMAGQTNRLFRGGNTIADRLEKMQKKPQFRDMKLIQHLEPVFAAEEGGTDHIIFRRKRFDKIDTDTLVADFADLFSRVPEFAHDLAVAGLLQYGVAYSPFTYVHIIPTKRFSEFANSTKNYADGLDGGDKIGLYSDYFNQFWYRNYDSDDITPSQWGSRLSAHNAAFPYRKEFERKKKFKEMTPEQRSAAREKGEREYHPIPTIYSNNTGEPQSLGNTIKDYTHKRILMGYQRLYAGAEAGTPTVETNSTAVIPEGSVGKIIYDTDKKTGYKSRTYANAKADATIYLANKEDSPGRKQTFDGVEAAEKADKKKRGWKDVYIPVKKSMPKNLKLADTQVDKVVTELNKSKAKTLNIAGNRSFWLVKKGYNQTDIDTIVYNFLKSVTEHPKLENEITEVWTGGQTGIDEAGAKAARRLGMTAIVRAPSNWAYRDKNNNQITNEKMFKKRFDQDDSFAQLSNASRKGMNAELNAKLVEWLNSVGIRYEGTEAIYDLDGNEIDAIAKADMFHKVVQIIEGKADITTLPEEAAHFLVEMLGEENPIFKGMMNAIEGTDILGEVTAEYGELYGHDEVKLKKEAIGKMIAKAVIAQDEKLSAKMKPWWQRAWSYIKRKLKQFTSKDIEQELAPYMEAANILLGEKESTDLGPLRSEEIFYQVTEEEKTMRDEVISNFRLARAFRRTDEEGYKTEAGRLILNRVSDYVKKFQNDKYRRTEPAGKYSLAADKGTVLHKYLEVMGRWMFENKEVSHGEVREIVTRELRAEATPRKDEEGNIIPSLAEKPDSFFNLTPAQFNELKNGLQGIIKQVKRRQNQVEKGGKVEFFPELIIYDEARDLAGTIDLAVVYSNGAVGIYDYKSITNLKNNQDKALYKEDEYEKQISQYKMIMSDAYGVTNFSETRIVPISMQLNNQKETFFDVVMGEKSINNIDRPYLKEIPVDKEMTNDPKLNQTIEKMLNLYMKLRAKSTSKPEDFKLRERVVNLRKNIQRLQIDSDINYIANEIDNLYRHIVAREHLPVGHRNGITEDMITEYKLLVDVYENFGENTMDIAKKVAKKDRKKLINKLEKVSFKLNTLKGILLMKHTEVLNDPERNLDVTASGKAQGFTGRLLNQISNFNQPAFKKLAYIIRQNNDGVRKRLDDLIDDEITVKHKALEEWAKSKGMSLRDAFKKIIAVDENDKTKTKGVLVSEYTKEFWEDLKEARESGDFAWMRRNMNIDYVEGNYVYLGKSLEDFKAAKEKFENSLPNRYPGKTAEAQKSRQEALNRWEAMFDITKNESAVINSRNFFLEFSAEEKYVSDEYKYISANAPLKAYYDMYVRLNREFGKMTGRNIRRNFIAEIHKDMIDMVGETGFINLGDMKDSFMRSMQIFEDDPSRGKIDLETGKPIPSIPLLFSNKLTKSLSKKKEDEIRAKLVSEDIYDENSLAFENELDRRIKAEEYKKGLESKSLDLTRSLVMFARAAYTHKALADTEDAALALRDILKSKAGSTELTDNKGRRNRNKFTKEVAKAVGVPLSEIEAFEQFINLHWYGQTTQGKDRAFGKDDKYSLTKAYQGIISLTSASALSFKPLLALGNLMNIWSNYQVIGAEGRRFSRENMKKAVDMYRNNKKEYHLAVAWVQPYVKDVTFRKANELSASKMVKWLTSDNLYFMHRHPDEMIDRKVTVSMMDRWGIEDGRLVQKENIKGEDKRSLLDRMSVVDDKIVIDGITNNKDQDQAERLYIEFRRMVQHTARSVKGNTSEEERNLASTFLAGQMTLHFRNWMKGMVEVRFKDLGYDDVFDDHDVGRFRVMAGEMVGKGLRPKLKAFINLAGEVAFLNMYNREGRINEEATKRYYDRYIEEYPEMAGKLTMEEFIDLRKAKLRGMATEVRMYLSFFALFLAGKAMLPEEEETSEMMKLIAQNNFRIAQRGLLEISFFFNPESALTILKSPIPSFRIFNDVYKMAGNTIDEVRDVIFGEDSSQDKKPPFYHAFKLVPVVSSAVDFFDVFDTYNPNRGY